MSNFEPKVRAFKYDEANLIIKLICGLNIFEATEDDELYEPQ